MHSILNSGRIKPVLDADARHEQVVDGQRRIAQNVCVVGWLVVALLVVSIGSLIAAYRTLHDINDGVRLEYSRLHTQLYPLIKHDYRPTIYHVDRLTKRIDELTEQMHHERMADTIMHRLNETGVLLNMLLATLNEVHAPEGGEARRAAAAAVPLRTRMAEGLWHLSALAEALDEARLAERAERVLGMAENATQALMYGGLGVRLGGLGGPVPPAAGQLPG